MDIRAHLSPRALVASAACLVLVVVVAAAPQLLGPRVADALDGLSAADADWLWAAGASFAASIAFAACGWRAALGLCGARLGHLDACARYGVGSLVNSATPARIGDVVRIALFARALPGDERLWTAGGACAAIAAARALALGVLVLAASAVGALPLWPVGLAASAVVAAAAVATLARRRSPGGRAAHVLRAFGTLGRRPAASLPLVAWILLATAARVGGAAASAAALGVDKPIHAALLIVPALDLAGVFPLTPGNVGVTSGAVALALPGVGVDLTTALAVGIALHAVETLAGIVVGTASALWLASAALDGGRGLALRIAGAAGAFAVAMAFGATTFV